MVSDSEIVCYFLRKGMVLHVLERLYAADDFFSQNSRVDIDFQRF